MRKYDDPRLISAEQLLEKARQIRGSEPELWNQLVDATSGDDPSVLCSTSGTTSNPETGDPFVWPLYPACRHLL